jgi:hypothetical protein
MTTARGRRSSSRFFSPPHVAEFGVTADQTRSLPSPDNCCHIERFVHVATGY